jgi:hypothetical protein
MVLYQEFAGNLKPPFYWKAGEDGSEDPSLHLRITVGASAV